jgi:hypothetical protein
MRRWGIRLVAAVLLSLWGSLGIASPLESRLVALESGFPGELGVHVRELGSGRTWGWRDEESWYLASLVKVPVAIELIEGAIALPEYRHPRRAFYIFGSEDGSLKKTQAIRSWCKDIVYIPTTGCMNLAATVNVVLYDRLCKSKATVDSNDVVKRSRDTNNRLVAS